MDTQKLLAKPKEQPQVVAKVTKINSLAKVTAQTNKSSRVLRRTFERGIYQRKTQLSILNRYKKRLDSINKEQDKRVTRKAKKEKPKFNIPKFKGSFFTPGSADDPLKAIGALAAFNALERMFDGDIMGGIMGPGMVAAAALLGPGILGMGADALFNRGPKPRRGFDVTGRRVSTSTQQRYLSRYGDKAFKNRFGNDALKRTRQGTNAVSNVEKGAKVATAFGRFGAALIPGVGAVVGAADAAIRAQSGDQFGAALSGTAATLDAAAAASAATGIGLPVAGLLSIASFALDATNLVRDLTGMSAAEEEKNKNKDKLKEQEKKQKALAEGSGNLTFSKTLVRYEKTITKFETFASQFGSSNKNFEGTSEGGGQDGGAPTPPSGFQPYDGPIAGDQFFPLPGGVLSTRDVGYAGGEYGASRGYPGGHSGQDIGGLDPGSPVIAWKTGKISYTGSVEAGDTILTIDHGGGIQSVYKHVVPTVPAGTVVYGGQQIATLFNARQYAPHLHFEVWKNGSHKNPMTEIQSSQRIGSPLSAERARSGKNKGGVAVGPKSGYSEILHGTELIIPVDNYHTSSGGDPLENVPTDIINAITSKSRKYQMAMADMPPEVIKVPIPISPPQIQYVSRGSGSLNIQNDSDKNILKMLYYSALG
jgi:murein DD-endopeptidase MepM/ murein hydrolase activator NlpD